MGGIETAFIAATRLSFVDKTPEVSKSRSSSTVVIEAKVKTRSLHSQQSKSLSSRRSSYVNPDAPRKLGIASLVLGVSGLLLALVGTFGLASVGTIGAGIMLAIAGRVMSIVSLVNNKKSVEKPSEQAPAIIDLAIS